MSEDFYHQALRIRAEKKPYVEACVIAVRGSSSAKPGSRALISAGGVNIWGWIGGGCAESYLIKQSLEALAEHKPRVVTVDLDDELLGVGMPCGGYMDVYLQPVFPPLPLWIAGKDTVSAMLARLAPEAGFAVTVWAEGADPKLFPLAERMVDLPGGQMKPEPGSFVVAAAGLDLPESDAYTSISQGFPTGSGDMALALGLLGKARAASRGADGQTLSLVQNKPPVIPPDCEMLIIGRGRISEELARLCVLAGIPVSVNDTALDPDHYPGEATLISDDLDLNMEGVTAKTCVVLAGQHKGDHKAALGAIGQGACYIGLIASRKRSGLILEYLQQQVCDADYLERFYAPAGLDIGAVTPFDIALSILLQILEAGN